MSKLINEFEGDVRKCTIPVVDDLETISDRVTHYLRLVLDKDPSKYVSGITKQGTSIYIHFKEGVKEKDKRRVMFMANMFV